MNLRLHNTLTGRVDPLEPLHPPAVGMYVCGLTVYSRGHVGNYRSFVACDLLRRTLRHLGYDVRHVMNITDVDDRIIDLAGRAGSELRAFTAEHIRTFEEDMATLRLERPEFVPRATDHIPEMIDVIERLSARGHTYVADGSVYFRVGSFPAYGELARLDFGGMKAGARVDSDRYEKEELRDFVLWKAKTEEPAWAQWDAPFGRGRPGWHIECSAMSMKYLGPTLDIHCGGIDLVFPHHENEIAQSACATGQTFARHWFHVAHLVIEGQKMSKSLGNVFNVPDIVERGHRPEAIRYLLCAAHYRSSLNLTWEGLQQAQAALDRVHGFVRRLGEVDAAGPVGDAAEDLARRSRQAFDSALADDLNTPEALAALHGLVGEGNALIAERALSAAGAARLRSEVDAMNGVFGVLLPGEEAGLSAAEQALFDARQAARRSREFAKADALRKELEALGVVLEDTARGTRWRRR
jgi:cysteinyl-tRNA synthetase